MNRLVIISIAGMAVLTAVLLITASLPQPQAAATNSGSIFLAEDHAYQVDLGLAAFKPTGQPGNFKLLGDFSPGGIYSAHVAVSNVNCDKAGKSPLAVLFANAQVGAPTPVKIVTLNSSNIITDVSFLGQFCTYHVETFGIVENQNTRIDQDFFRITDIAIVNTNKGSSVQPHPTASATLHVSDCEQNINGYITAGRVPFIPCGEVYGTATLTLYKEVTNDDGGDAGPSDFKLFVGSDEVSSGSSVTLLANTAYTIDESALEGYEFDSITGDPECPDAPGDSITLDAGDYVTCTIINDDIAPTLTLIKDPTNDDGGDALPDDFGLTVGGNSVTSNVAVTLLANTNYTIDESALEGYEFDSITGDPECPNVLGGNVTMDEGEDITCTIINDDIAPTLTLIKEVISNNGGGPLSPGDFELFVGVDQVSSGSSVTLLANTAYTIGENIPPDYIFYGITGDPECPDVLGGTVTLDEGEDITCTIINEYAPIE